MTKTDRVIRPKISPGYRWGSLLVESDTGERKSGYTIWKCICQCGNVISMDTRSIQRGTRKDCGCETKVKPGQRDLTGQRFGLLTVLETREKRSAAGSVVWRCICDCGREIDVPAAQLTQGYRKSCGCLSRPQLKDYIGKRFGQLTVTAYDGKSSGMHRWRCMCDCGEETIVGQTLLQSGKTKSCGCLQAKSAVENMKFVAGTSITLLERSGNRLIRSNSSGYNGVYFNQRAQKWTAQIGFKGKNYYLGTFDKIEEAVEVRKKAEEQIFCFFVLLMFGLRFVIYIGIRKNG